MFSQFENIKIILPSAPIRYVTIENKENWSWFDIKSKDKDSLYNHIDQSFST